MNAEKLENPEYNERPMQKKMEETHLIMELFRGSYEKDLRTRVAHANELIPVLREIAGKSDTMRGKIGMLRDWGYTFNNTYTLTAFNAIRDGYSDTNVRRLLVGLKPRKIATDSFGNNVY